MKTTPNKQAVGNRWPVVGHQSAVVPLPAAGFTLVEMLVALALVSIIVTMVYGSYAAASRAMDSYHSRMTCSDRTCLVLRLMARQFRCAYLPSFATERTTTPLQGDTSSTSTTTPRVEPLDAGGDILSFATTAEQGLGPDQSTGLVRVMYRLEPLSGTLSFCSEPYVYDVNSTPETRNWQTLLNNVRSMDVQFYDGRQWQSGWTGGAAQTLPQGARIALTVVDEKNREQEFKTMVPIGCRSAPQNRQIGVPAQRNGENHAKP